MGNLTYLYRLFLDQFVTRSIVRIIIAIRESAPIVTTGKENIQVRCVAIFIFTSCDTSECNNTIS